jgi:hypothetical protein
MRSPALDTLVQFCRYSFTHDRTIRQWDESRAGRIMIDRPRSESRYLAAATCFSVTGGALFPQADRMYVMTAAMSPAVS